MLVLQKTTMKKKNKKPPQKTNKIKHKNKNKNKKRFDEWESKVYCKQGIWSTGNSAQLRQLIQSTKNDYTKQPTKYFFI